MLKRIRQIVRAARKDPHQLVEGIHSARIFRAFLVRERTLAERIGYCVCVLAFPFPGKTHSTANARLFSRVCAKHLRATDVIGWLDDSTAAVLLAHTSVAGATKVAEKIAAKLAESGLTLDFRVYSFPYDPPPGDLTSPPSSPPADGAKPARRKSASAAPSSPASAVRSKAPATDKSDMAATVSAAPLPAEHPLPLDDLHIQPLPVWKRATDIVLSLLALIVLSPLLVVIAIMIEIVSPGPLFFSQERVGYRGRRFMLHKFRSMRPVADTQIHQDHLKATITSNAPLTKLDHHDPRVIPLGRVFRASGLDELPQLYNILRGDMSLIGPRPCVPYEYENFQTWHKRRFHVLPGLTGLWQVSGKNATTFEEMMRFDSAYTRQLSIMEDLRILLKTIPVVVCQVLEMRRKNKGGST